MVQQNNDFFKNSLRIILCVVVLSAFPYKAYAIDQDILSVKILTISPDICIGHLTLDLEAVLTNETSRTIEINSAGVEGGIKVFKYERNIAAPLFVTIDDLDIDYFKDKWVRIPPHKSVVILFSEPLSDEDSSLVKALNNTGPYAILIEFAVYERLKNGRIIFRGTVESNMAMFMIGDCSNKSIESAPISVLDQPQSPKVWVVVAKPSVNTLVHESVGIAHHAVHLHDGPDYGRIRGINLGECG
ncbi:MAG TPA: hypothetical protein VGE85_10405 [Terracidiphilus sp.]|jgi:hypothetical protein